MIYVHNRIMDEKTFDILLKNPDGTYDYKPILTVLTCNHTWCLSETSECNLCPLTCPGKYQEKFQEIHIIGHVLSYRYGTDEYGYYLSNIEDIELSSDDQRLIEECVRNTWGWKKILYWHGPQTGGTGLTGGSGGTGGIGFTGSSGGTGPRGLTGGIGKSGHYGKTGGTGTTGGTGGCVQVSRIFCDIISVLKSHNLDITSELSDETRKYLDI